MRLTCAFLMASCVSLQTQAADPAKREDIRKFFAITNTAELAFAGMQQNIELQKQANPEIPAAFWVELPKAMKRDELMERMVPIYDKHFTHDEIRAWIAFFESKPGQAFLKNQRVVLEESAVAGQAYVQEVGGPILHRLRSK